MIAVKGVKQSVLQHGVDEFHLAHLHAAAQIGGMRGKRHRLLPAGHDDIGVAARDLLQSERNRAQAAAAQLVDAEGGFLLWHASLHRRLAGGILALPRGKDLAENHLVDLAGVDLRRRQSSFYGDRAKVVRRGRAKGAIERAHSGSFCAGDDNLRSSHVNLPCAQ